MPTGSLEEGVLDRLLMRSKVSEIGRWPGVGLRDEGPPSRDERGQTWSPC